MANQVKPAELPARRGRKATAQASGEGRGKGRARERTYTTGEMARLSNNTLRTVRFYEEAGILRPLRRTEGGHRLFTERELDRLLLVSDMRAAGLGLDEIRTLLETKQRAVSGGDAAKIASEALGAYVVSLADKVEALQRLRTDLERTIEVAAGCISCEEPALFPDRCGECNRMIVLEMPRALRVLWSVGQGPASVAPTGVSTDGPGGGAEREPEQA